MWHQNELYVIGLDVIFKTSRGLQGPALQSGGCFEFDLIQDKCKDFAYKNKSVIRAYKETILFMGFMYAIKCICSRKSAENRFPYILA